jgi:hypothetical protein
MRRLKRPTAWQEAVAAYYRERWAAEAAVDLTRKQMGMPPRRKPRSKWK